MSYVIAATYLLCLLVFLFGIVDGGAASGAVPSPERPHDQSGQPAVSRPVAPITTRPPGSGESPRHTSNAPWGKPAHIDIYDIFVFNCWKHLFFLFMNVFFIFFYLCIEAQEMDLDCFYMDTNCLRFDHYQMFLLLCCTNKYFWPLIPKGWIGRWTTIDLPPERKLVQQFVPCSAIT